MFAAEATGRPGFIVPGLIAAVVAQLFMGKASMSPYQMAERAGHLERRFVLPLSSALRTDAPTVPPDTTIEEFVWNHLLAHRQQVVAVVDGGAYLGVMRADEALAVPETSGPRRRWPTTCRPTSRRSGQRRSYATRSSPWRRPTSTSSRWWTTTFIGVVTTNEILSLDEILERGEETP